MRKMSTGDIQQVSLDILKDVHEFCVAQGINYTLFGGTLIGAIRHKGFIPWDDDLDIAMPRPDYDKFVNSYFSSRGYQLFARERHGKSVYLTYARVCDMNKTYVAASSYPWSTFKTGIWIDIFPLDGMPDKLSIARRHTHKANTLFRKINKYRHLMAIVQREGMISLKSFIAKMLLPYYNRCDKLMAECERYDYLTAKHFSNLAFGGYGMKEYCNKNVLKGFSLHQFAGEAFFVMDGYDEALKSKYGDYMTPPPENEQLGNHGYGYYWT